MFPVELSYVLAAMLGYTLLVAVWAGIVMLMLWSEIMDLQAKIKELGELVREDQQERIENRARFEEWRKDIRELQTAVHDLVDTLLAAFRPKTIEQRKK